MDITAGDGTITLPGMLPAAHKVRSVHALAHGRCRVAYRRIDHIDVDLGAAKISVTGTGAATEQGQTFTRPRRGQAVPVDRLGDYWPLDSRRAARRGRSPI